MACACAVIREVLRSCSAVHVPVSGCQLSQGCSHRGHAGSRCDVWQLCTCSNQHYNALRCGSAWLHEAVACSHCRNDLGCRQLRKGCAAATEDLPCQHAKAVHIRLCCVPARCDCDWTLPPDWQGISRTRLEGQRQEGEKDSCKKKVERGWDAVWKCKGRVSAVCQRQILVAVTQSQHEKQQCPH